MHKHNCASTWICGRNALNYHHVQHMHTNTQTWTSKFTNTVQKGSCTHKNNWTWCAIVCLQAYFHRHAHTALGQGDSGSSEPAVTCRSRCSGKPLLTATIDDLIKLSPRRSAAGGGDGGMAWVCVCEGGVGWVGVGWEQVGGNIQEALCMLTVSPNWEWQSQ